MSPSKLTLVTLALLVLAACGLRLRGIDHGLPTTLEQDCKIPRQVELLRQRGSEWRSDKDFAWYPLLTAHLVKLWPEAHPAPPSATLEEHLAAAAAPHVQARTTVALLGLLAIPLTYLLCSWFLERHWSVVAAAFVAFSLLHLQFSQQSRPHVVAGTAFLAAVVAAVRMRRKGDVINFSAAGGAAALSIGCLHSGVLVLPALLVAFFARRTLTSKWRDARVALLLLPLALALPFFYPTLVFGSSVAGAAAVKQFGFDSASWTLFVGGHEIFLKQFLGRGIAPTVWALYSYEPVLLALLLAAGALWIVRRWRHRPAAPAPEQFTRRRDAWVVIAFVAPYATALLLYERTYERFLIPLLPYLAMAAAFALREIAQLLAPGVAALRRPLGQLVFAAGALAPSAYVSLKLTEARAAPHTTTRASRWLTEHARPSQDIGLWPQLDLPLLRDPAHLGAWPGDPSTALDARFAWPWARYQTLHMAESSAERWRLRWWKPKLVQMQQDPAAYLREQAGELAVIEVFAGGRTHPGGTAVRLELMRSARLVARFSPDSDPLSCDHPLGYQEETSVPPPHFFSRVLGASGTGPVIEIYELGRR
ncbi:MAG: hypothetical protein IT454_12620 [Planctomycetes bacterium]|nr:hypothetical protein [Planctomycetota bacterium]